MKPKANKACTTRIGKNMEYGLLRFALSTSWRVISFGNSIIRAAEGIEARAAAPYTLRCGIAWRLLGLGRRVETFGEALEAWVDLRARRAGFDTDVLLAPFLG